MFWCIFGSKYLWGEFASAPGQTCPCSGRSSSSHSSLDRVVVGVLFTYIYINISKLFAAKYDDLYNSVAYNEEDMATLLQNIHSKVDAQCNDCENIVIIDDVLNGINHVTNVMDTGWYIPITLFVLLTNYMFFYLCYSHQWCITGIPRMFLI